METMTEETMTAGTPRLWPPWTPASGTSPEVWGGVGEATGDSAGRRVAVFDADGTLWAEDVGDVHLRVLEERGLIRSPPGEPGVFDAYLRLCRQDPGAGYAFAVEVMAGLSEDVVRETAREAWARHRDRLLEPVTRLLRTLGRVDVEVWVVSASNRWVVEAAAVDALGLSPDRVVAMACDVVDGRLTGEVIEPRPNGPGKVEAIREWIGVRPRLAFGNSLHDADMLDDAARGVLVRAHREPATPPLSGDLAARRAAGGWLVLPVRWG
ncbi:MAG: HAD family hydrolase [Myxococcota bacterium]